MSHLRSCLARMVADNPMTEAEKDERARDAWRAHSDMVALRISVIHDDIVMQIVINELTRQHGARPKRRNA